MRIVVAGMLGCAVLGSAGDARAQISDRLVACAARVDDADRLACYDSAVKALGAEARAASEAREATAKAARAEAEASAAAAAAAQKAAQRTDNFGKPVSSADAVSELVAKVSEVLTDRNRKAVFVLDNGQMWRHADDPSLPGLKAGTEVVIKRGAMGSFRLMPAGLNRSVQVIRIR